MQDSHAIDKEQTRLIETPKRESHSVTGSLIASCLGCGAGAGVVMMIKAGKNSEGRGVVARARLVVCPVVLTLSLLS